MSQTDTDEEPAKRPQLSLEIDNTDEELSLERVPVDLIRLPEASGPDSRLRKSIDKLPFFTSVTLRSLGPAAVEEEGYAYEVVAGERRVSRAKAANYERIPAIILPKEAESYAPIVALAENIARDKNPLREALEIYTLRSNGHSEEDLEAYGIPVQRQKKAMRLALAPDPIIEGVREGDISVGAARKVGNMEAAMQSRCADHYQETGELRHRDIRQIREEHKSAEAEEIGTELFEDAPSPEDFGDSLSGNQSDSTESEPESSSISTPESTLSETKPPPTGDPLAAIRHAVEMARDKGFDERAILRSVHNALLENR